MNSTVLQLFPAKAVKLGQFVILIEAVLRGWSYLVTPSGAVISMTSAERTAPLWAWGAVFLTLALVALAAEAHMARIWRIRNRKAMFRNPLQNWVAPGARYCHIAMMILMVVLGFSSWAGIFDRTPLYGFYAPWDVWVLAFAHWVFTIRGNQLGVVAVQHSQNGHLS